MAKRMKGSNPLAVIGTVGGNAKTGTIRAPRKVMVTDRRVTAGRKESAITEFAQSRHEFTGEYVRRTPAKRSPVRNGSLHAARIAQMPKGTKPVWR